MIELRNRRTKMLVDCRSGSIVRIEDAATGVVHIDASRAGHADGRLFRVLVPTDTWWACYADSQEQTQVRCQQQGSRVTLDYPDLKAADGHATGVAVRVEISPGEMPDEFCFRMRIENHGQRMVLDAAFPLLGGWYEHGTSSRFALGANSFVSPRYLGTSAGNNYARNGRRADWSYPVSLACPWVDVFGPDGGLAYVNYMTEGRNGKFWIENLAGYGDDFRLMFGWCHLLALRPGQSWTSPLMGVAVHAGDWRVTADRYTAWFDGVHAPDYSRPGIRSRMGFQNVFFRGFDGTPIRGLDTLPQAAAAGRRYGVDLLCVWDVLTIGNYARHDPRDLTDYSAAERETIVAGLRQAEAEGTSTCALINFRHPNVALHLPDPHLLDRVQRRYCGTPRWENWAVGHSMGGIGVRHIGPDSYVFSPFAPAHRERVLRLTRDYLSLGYTSIFYDQPFEADPDYGFLDRGQVPDTTHHEALQLVGAVRQLLLANNPQAVVIGEESDIHATPFIDQWMSWSIAAPSPQLIERVTMMRYAMPHTMLSWVVDHEVERAVLAFAMGMQLCLMVHGAEGTLADEPAFAERVHALARLRQQTANRTVMARFRGQDGLAVDGDNKFAAFAYQSPAGPAIIVAAYGEPAKGKVAVNPAEWGVTNRAAEGVVFKLDGSPIAHKGMTCEFDLGANDVAVWTLQVD